MLKLLRNYLREQNKSLLQILGLGLLIIIMIASFLSINFANEYVKNQFWNQITDGVVHQNIQFDLNADPIAEPVNVNDNSLYCSSTNSASTKEFNNIKSNRFSSPWLENLDYETDKKDDTRTSVINREKLRKATFQLSHLSQYNKKKNNFYYRFTFNDSKQNIYVGENLTKKTAHTAVNFKIDYPKTAFSSDNERIKKINSVAKILDQYVFDENVSKTENKTNFLIFNKLSLDYYNDNLLNHDDTPYAKKSYNIDDVNNFNILYQQMVMNILFNQDHLQLIKDAIVKDLIMTGKTIAFIQTNPNDQINRPILVNDGGRPLSKEPLQDKEILVYPHFAKVNNLKIGDHYNFSGKEFIIRGFATSSVAANTGAYFNRVIDNANQTIGFVNANTMNNILKSPLTKIRSNHFVGLKPEDASKVGTNDSDKFFINNGWLYQYLHNKLNNLKDSLPKNKQNSVVNLPNVKNGIDVFSLFEVTNRIMYNTNTVEWDSLAAIKTLTNISTTISSVFVVLILFITTIIVFIVFYKIIDRNKKLIGVLKASGYQNWKITTSLVISLMLPIAFFVLSGILVSIFTAHFVINAYGGLMSLVSYGWTFNLSKAIISVVVPLIILSMTSFIFVYHLLSVKPLLLINDKKNENKKMLISNFLNRFTSRFLIKKINYKNKLSLITAIRSLPKLFFILLVSFFASTLVLFSFSTSILVRDMLGLQFASVQYNFSSNYDYNDIYNFIDDNGHMRYKKMEVNQLKKERNNDLYEELIYKLKKIFIDHEFVDPVINTRSRYIMGSELAKIAQFINNNRKIIEKEHKNFINFWDENQFFINYLTNKDSNNNIDLMTTFGLIPYEDKYENPTITIYPWESIGFDIDKINDSQFYYDKSSKQIVGKWDNFGTANVNLMSTNAHSSNDFNFGFNNTTLDLFNDLSIKKMSSSTNWLDQNFVKIKEKIMEKFQISKSDLPNIPIVPIIASTNKLYQDKTINTKEAGINHIGKAIYYKYPGFFDKDQFAILIVYDTATKLLNSNTLIPETLLNNMLFTKHIELSGQYANTKYSKFNEGEFKHYFSLLSKVNDYNIDLTKVGEPGYIENEKQISPALTNMIDVTAAKRILNSMQGAFQSIIMLFAIMSFLLSFLIIAIISNINIRDNLRFINTLKKIGFNNKELVYIFLVATIPLIIIFSIFSIYILPYLINFIAVALGSYTKQVYVSIFRWWYFPGALGLILIIYLVSFAITWKLNINNKQLLY